MDRRKLTMQDLHWRPIGATVRTRNGEIHTVTKKIFAHYTDLDGTFYDFCNLTYLLDNDTVLAPNVTYEVLSLGTSASGQPRMCEECQRLYIERNSLLPEVSHGARA